MGIAERIMVSLLAVLVGLAGSYAWLAGSLGFPSGAAAWIYDITHLVCWALALTALVLGLSGRRRCAWLALLAAGLLVAALFAFLALIEPRWNIDKARASRLDHEALLADTALETLNCRDGFVVHLSNPQPGRWMVTLLRAGDPDYPHRRVASFSLVDRQQRCETSVDRQLLADDRDLLASCANPAGRTVEDLVAWIQDRSCPYPND